MTAATQPCERCRTCASLLQGTQALFDASQSTVQLVGDVQADEQEVSFRFQEELAFNVPFKPKTTLSGTLVLKRGMWSPCRGCRLPVASPAWLYHPCDCWTL